MPGPSADLAVAAGRVLTPDGLELGPVRAVGGTITGVDSAKAEAGFGRHVSPDDAWRIRNGSE